MVVIKRLLLPALLLVVVVASSAYYFYKSPGEVAANVTYCRVDIASFNWSGQNEGETVKVNPDFPPGVIGFFMPPFNRFSLVRGIDEAAKRLGGGVPLLPTLLPEGMNYADVYVGPVVHICFSYAPAQDQRFADIVIEISCTSHPSSLEELKGVVSSLPELKLIQVEDIWVIFHENEQSYQGAVYDSGRFDHNGLYYQMSARHPLTMQDLIKIIGSMKTPY